MTSPIEQAGIRAKQGRQTVAPAEQKTPDMLPPGASVASIGPRTRSWTALGTMFGYGVILLVILVAIIVFRCGQPDKAIPEMMELLKIGVLPVVTFIIGRYFDRD